MMIFHEWKRSGHRMDVDRWPEAFQVRCVFAATLDCCVCLDPNCWLIMFEARVDRGQSPLPLSKPDPAIGRQLLVTSL